MIINSIDDIVIDGERFIKVETPTFICKKLDKVISVSTYQLPITLEDDQIMYFYGIEPPNMIRVFIFVLNDMREIFKVTEEEVGDFTSKDQWIIDNETYVFIEEQITGGDGIGHDVYVQRQSDKKYFTFSWLFSFSENYYYYPEWKEVKQKEIKTNKYFWE